MVPKGTAAVISESFIRCGQLLRNDANIRKIAVLFRVIQAVADDEFVRNAEADVVCLDRLLSARRLVEQRGDAERFRFARAKSRFM